MIPLLALAAWRRRARPELRDALWRAMLREHEAQEVLHHRPRSLTATYQPSELELRLRRQIDAENRARRKCGKEPIPSLIPWLHASAEEALDLRARERVERLLEEAAAIVAEDPEASDLVALEELELGLVQTSAKGPSPRPHDWRRARRAAWT